MVKSMKNLGKKTLSFLLKSYSILLRELIDILTDIASSNDFIRIAYLDFVPRPDDIFIVTYPRSGTTWMQMILYQLATDGNMDFPHIAQVCPWFDRSIMYNIMDGSDFEKLPSPRIFKSHLSYKRIPKGSCKYIYVARDGQDVAVSYFHFYNSHLNFKGTFSEFFDKYFMRGKVQFGLWFTHVAQWQKHENYPNVLFLKYEDLVNDFKGTLQKIINFCGFQIEDERLPEIMERCSYAFMKKYEDKFDHISGMIWEKGYKQNSFIRKGQAGSGKEYLTNQQKDQFIKELNKWGLGKLSDENILILT